MPRLRSFVGGYWSESLQRLRELAEGVEESEHVEESEEETDVQKEKSRERNHGWLN
jgi:hypothetical protein